VGKGPKTEEVSVGSVVFYNDPFELKNKKQRHYGIIVKAEDGHSFSGQQRYYRIVWMTVQPIQVHGARYLRKDFTVIEQPIDNMLG